MRLNCFHYHSGHGDVPIGEGGVLIFEDFLCQSRGADDNSGPFTEFDSDDGAVCCCKFCEVGVELGVEGEEVSDERQPPGARWEWGILVARFFYED